ncbi:MAG: hypothetical protein J5806_03000 [Lentisphaeria bacterium]|nr:hypothetical protein [Lentisphaeria bacterium]
MTFDEANAFIRDRSSKTTTMGSLEISRSVPPRIRAHCFFSARVADERVLAKIREISDAFSSGSIDRGEARHALRMWMKANGQDNGSASIRNLASTARIDLILTQNKRMAVAVGKYEKDRSPAVEERFPCWQYHCGRNARDSHKALDGKIFRKNDPIWQKIFPPWEFNCNCWVENSDEDPAAPEIVEKLTPKKTPASGFQFDPSDAFEDYRTDRYKFDGKEPAAIVKAKSDAETLKKDQLKQMYRDVEDRQPGIIEQADDFWNGLDSGEKELIHRYTAGDQFDLNKVSRGAADITDEASKEMDELSEVLKKAPKYTGGQCYRVINVYSNEAMKDLSDDLEDSIFGLKGFNSTSVSMDAAKRYANDKAFRKVVFHIVRHRNGAFIGHHSWVNVDKEVLFDKKSKFRALHSWEKGYINPDSFNDGFVHIAIVEV